MNVGGHRVQSDELRSLFEALGFTDVRVFRASGNVVFAAAREPVAELTARSEAGLEEALGFGRERPARAEAQRGSRHIVHTVGPRNRRGSAVTRKPWRA
jgi:uncharacterized protein (DUF1697 family)